VKRGGFVLGRTKKVGVLSLGAISLFGVAL